MVVAEGRRTKTAPPPSPPPPPRQGTRGAEVALGGNPGLAPTVVAVAAPGGWDPGLAPTAVVAEGRRTKEG